MSIEIEIETKMVKERYLNIKEAIFNALNPQELNIYMHLRFKADFKKEVDEVASSQKKLCLPHSIGRSMFYDILNDLEFKYYLIQRIEQPGQCSKYLVSQTLHYFRTIEPVRVADTPVRVADTPCPSGGYVTTNSFNNSFNKPLKSPSGTDDDVEKEGLNKKKKQSKKQSQSKAKVTEEQCKEFFLVWNKIMADPGRTQSKPLHRIQSTLKAGNKIVKWWLSIGKTVNDFESYLIELSNNYSGWVYGSWDNGKRNSFLTLCSQTTVEKVANEIIPCDKQKQYFNNQGKQ